MNGYASGPPSVPLLFLMSKTERIEATIINIVESAKYFPGQARLPNPNSGVNTRSSRKPPFGSINRSGLKESGSGYVTGS